ncbi:MAG: hypothetical protein AAGI53_13400 [Planctomycetota bacterium]
MRIENRGLVAFVMGSVVAFTAGLAAGQVAVLGEFSKQMNVSVSPPVTDFLCRAFSVRGLGLAMIDVLGVGNLTRKYLNSVRSARFVCERAVAQRRIREFLFEARWCIAPLHSACREEVWSPLGRCDLERNTRVEV